MVTRIPTIVTMNISSRSVKPCSPVTIHRPIQRDLRARRGQIIHIISAPGRRVRGIREAPYPPVGLPGQRVHRDPPQVALDRRPFHGRFFTRQLHFQQGLKGLRIPGHTGRFLARKLVLDAQRTERHIALPVPIQFKRVNGRPDRPKLLTQLELARPLPRHFGERHGDRRQHHDDGDRDQQFEERGARLADLSLVSHHWTLTLPCPPVAETGAFAALSNCDVWIATGEAPGSFATNARVARTPVPVTPLVPSGRVSRTATVPVAGLAAVVTEAVPSRFKNSPSNAWRNSKTLGS